MKTPQIPTAPLNGLATAGWLIVVTWGLATARDFLIPICIAGLFSFMITPVVEVLRRHRVPEWVALTASALLLVLPFAGVGFELIKQGQKLVADFPSIMTSFQHILTGIANHSWAQKLGLSTDALDLQSLLQKISQDAGKGVALLVGGLGIIMDASSQTALILIFAILMTASRNHLRTSAENILKSIESIEAPALLDEVTSLIGRFLSARILIVCVVGIADGIALRAFGVDYSFLLGALIGFMTLVPNIGFFLALVPTLIVTLATGHSGSSTLVLTGILVLVSFIEGNVLSPKLVGSHLNINTLTSFIGFFAGGLLWGVWGMLLSVPILGILRIVFSAIPSLQPWGDLLADKKDHRLADALARSKGRVTPLSK
jgi:predicted PurR-regulated permease PerM